MRWSLQTEGMIDRFIFFARYPRTLLSSESLASFLGYDLKDIAESLDVPVTSTALIITAYLVTLAVLIPVSGWLK